MPTPSVEFRLDRRGISEILRSAEMRHAITEVARQVAADTRAHLPADVDVDTRPYTSDRQGSTVASASHAATDAEHRAALIRAARATGLEVHEYPPTE